MRSRNEQPPAVLIKRALAEVGATIDAAGAAKVAGIQVRNAREYLKLLHGKRQIHVARWGFNGQGPRFPIFADGDGVDAEKPDTARQKAARRRARRIVTQRDMRGLLG